MTASRRMKMMMVRAVAAAMAFAVAVPAMAQNSDAPVDVTAAPPPSAETVGPSQLRDFTLNGTVTRPADRPAASAPAATVATPQPGTVSRSPAAESPPTGQPTREITATASPRGSSGAPLSADSPSPSPADVTGPATGSITQPSLDVTVPPPADPVSAASTGAMPGWPWILAVIAAIGGGAYLLRGHRARRRRYADFGRLAFAGPQPDQVPEGPRNSPTPAPVPTPRNHPIPPGSGTAAPRPDPVPSPKKPASDGLITSARLKPELNVHFTPDRAVVTEHEVMLQFDMLIVNSGSAPARDVLVEARLVCAHAAQDGEIAMFFQQPAGTGDRMAAIQPLNRISLKSAVRLPIDQLHSFEVDGRSLFVPLVAFNVHFRSGSGDGQASASFLVGRGGDEDEKLAPFRLDLGPRIFRGLSARPHSMGLSR